MKDEIPGFNVGVLRDGDPLILGELIDAKRIDWSDTTSEDLFHATYQRLTAKYSLTTVARHWQAVVRALAAQPGRGGVDAEA